MSAEHNQAGLYCYVATPYNATGDVDAAVLHDYVNQMVAAEVDGITCVASTCDGPYLTERERRTVVETVGKAVGGRMGINVGVAAVSTRQVIEYARHAKDHGATNLMIEMQQYLPISFDAMRRHYEEIAAAVDLPIRLYNLPIPTRVDMLPPMVHELAAIPAIRSVKDASGDVTRLTQIRAACGDRLTLFCGLHFNLLEGMRARAQGWEVTLHPLFAKEVVRLYRQVAKDPESEASRQAFMRWSPLFLFFRQYGVPQSIRALSERTEMKLGPVRRPQNELSPAQKDEVWELTLRALDQQGQSSMVAIDTQETPQSNTPMCADLR